MAHGRMDRLQYFLKLVCQGFCLCDPIGLINISHREYTGDQDLSHYGPLVEGSRPLKGDASDQEVF